MRLSPVEEFLITLKVRLLPEKKAEGLLYLITESTALQNAVTSKYFYTDSVLFRKNLQVWTHIPPVSFVHTPRVVSTLKNGHVR